MEKTFWIFAAVLIASVSFAQEAEQKKEPEVEKKGISTTISFGTSLADGNSETMQNNVEIIVEGEKQEIGSFRAGLESNYGEATVNDVDETTIDNTRGYANLKKTITEKTFLYMDFQAMRDNIAEIDYRAMFSGGPGVYLIKNKSTYFFIEAGPSYIWDEVGGEEDNYLAYRFDERIEHNLGEKSKIWHEAEFLPKASDFDDYLITAEIGVESALISLLKLRIVLKDEYDSQPGDELEKNDITLTAGVSLTL